MRQRNLMDYDIDWEELAQQTAQRSALMIIETDVSGMAQCVLAAREGSCFRDYAEFCAVEVK